MKLLRSIHINYAFHILYLQGQLFKLLQGKKHMTSVDDASLLILKHLDGE